MNEQPRPLPAASGVPGLLSALIHERTGHSFEPDRWDHLMEKLEPLAEQRGCRSFLEYYYLLRYQDNGPEDWDRVMDALSVQETYFWREMPQVHALVDRIIPQWFQKNVGPLKIWSAASATGEEPFSIVMALAEAGWLNHPIELYASDSSPSALEKARRRIFREKSFRALPAPLRSKYFKQCDGGWEFDAELARRVTFHRANLLAADEISDLARCPVVFCRNVFIYFSAHAIRQTLATFASRMPRQGHLFVGISESLLRLTADFELREMAGAYVYVKT